MSNELTEPGETLLGQGPSGEGTSSPDADRMRVSLRAALFGEKPQWPVIGRYSILDLLGEGAMGTVFSAYDPDLDRRVALKVLHAAAGADGRRLVDEARALARLSHPNVVAVYDAGVADERVHIAMEFVEGVSLRVWLEGERRGFSAIFPVLVQAARGLAAAHRAGVVHRDFKPDNVLVGKDGRVRVADFGLAITRAEQAEGTAVAGTPAYMAPEQFEGEPGPCADQYAFCVTAFEALYGSRPSLGRVIAEELAEPSERGDVPSAVYDVLARGLKADPARRFADMDALLGALQSAARRRRRMAIAATALLVVGAAILLTPRASDRCADAGAAWGARGPGDAPLDAAVAQRIDDYRRQWVEARVEACSATRERGEVSAAILERRIACLEDRRVRVKELLGALSTAEDPVFLAEDLPSVDACGDLGALATIEGPSVTARETFARARAAQDGDPSLAIELAGEAFTEAMRARDHRLAAEIAALLAALQVPRGDASTAWADAGEALCRRLADPRDLQLAFARSRLAVASAAGDDDEAAAQLRRATDLAAALGRPATVAALTAARTD